MFRARHMSIGGVVWIVIGVIVASSHHYFATLDTAGQIISAVLAIIAWPLVLLNIHIGI